MMPNKRPQHEKRCYQGLIKQATNFDKPDRPSFSAKKQRQSDFIQGMLRVEEAAMIGRQREHMSLEAEDTDKTAQVIFSIQHQLREKATIIEAKRAQRQEEQRQQANTSPFKRCQKRHALFKTQPPTNRSSEFDELDRDFHIVTHNTNHKRQQDHAIRRSASRSPTRSRVKGERGAEETRQSGEVPFSRTTKRMNFAELQKSFEKKAREEATGHKEFEVLADPPCLTKGVTSGYFLRKNSDLSMDFPNVKGARARRERAALNAMKTLRDSTDGSRQEVATAQAINQDEGDASPKEAVDLMSRLRNARSSAGTTKRFGEEETPEEEEKPEEEETPEDGAAGAGDENPEGEEVVEEEEEEDGEGEGGLVSDADWDRYMGGGEEALAEGAQQEEDAEGEGEGEVSYDAAVEMAGDWAKYMDPESGYHYYQNLVTGITQWEEPEGYQELKDAAAVAEAEDAAATADYEEHLWTEDQLQQWEQSQAEEKEKERVQQRVQAKLLEQALVAKAKLQQQLQLQQRQLQQEQQQEQHGQLRRTTAAAASIAITAAAVAEMRSEKARRSTDGLRPGDKRWLVQWSVMLPGGVGAGAGWIPGRVIRCTEFVDHSYMLLAYTLDGGAQSAREVPANDTASIMLVSSEDADADGDSADAVSTARELFQKLFMSQRTGQPVQQPTYKSLASPSGLVRTPTLRNSIKRLRNSFKFTKRNKKEAAEEQEQEQQNRAQDDVAKLASQAKELAEFEAVAAARVLAAAQTEAVVSFPPNEPNIICARRVQCVWRGFCQREKLRSQLRQDLGRALTALAHVAVVCTGLPGLEPGRISPSCSQPGIDKAAIARLPFLFSPTAGCDAADIVKYHTHVKPALAAFKCRWKASSTDEDGVDSAIATIIAGGRASPTTSTTEGPTMYSQMELRRLLGGVLRMKSGYEDEAEQQLQAEEAEKEVQANVKAQAQAQAQAAEEEQRRAAQAEREKAVAEARARAAAERARAEEEAKRKEAEQKAAAAKVSEEAEARNANEEAALLVQRCALGASLGEKERKVAIRELNGAILKALEKGHVSAATLLETTLKELEKGPGPQATAPAPAPVPAPVPAPADDVDLSIDLDEEERAMEKRLAVQREENERMEKELEAGANGGGDSPDDGKQYEADFFSISGSEGGGSDREKQPQQPEQSPEQARAHAQVATAARQSLEERLAQAKLTAREQRDGSPEPAAGTASRLPPMPKAETMKEQPQKQAQPQPSQKKDPMRSSFKRLRNSFKMTKSSKKQQQQQQEQQQERSQEEEEKEEENVQQPVEVDSPVQLAQNPASKAPEKFEKSWLSLKSQRSATLWLHDNANGTGAWDSASLCKALGGGVSPRAIGSGLQIVAEGTTSEMVKIYLFTEVEQTMIDVEVLAEACYMCCLPGAVKPEQRHELRLLCKSADGEMAAGLIDTLTQRLRKTAGLFEEIPSPSGLVGLQAVIRGRLARQRVRGMLEQAWQRQYDANTGGYYYVNQHTQQSQWHQPALLSRLGGAITGAEDVTPVAAVATASYAVAPLSAAGARAIAASKTAAAEPVAEKAQQADEFFEISDDDSDDFGAYISDS
jgi:hypothetical protein